MRFHFLTFVHRFPLLSTQPSHTQTPQSLITSPSILRARGQPTGADLLCLHRVRAHSSGGNETLKLHTDTILKSSFHYHFFGLTEFMLCFTHLSSVDKLTAGILFIHTGAFSRLLSVCLQLIYFNLYPISK